MFWVKQTRLWTLVCGAMRSVPDGAQQRCISWKCWIASCFHNEVVADFMIYNSCERDLVTITGALHIV
jgi:hypothetical protein